MSEKTIENWEIAAVHNGGICLIGFVNDKKIQTSNIKEITFNKIKTETGSIYKLGKVKDTLWKIQLQIKRPEEYAKLSKFDIV